ncbi:pyridoxamine 5'-phosphate oxidase family protein [Saccharothrix sp. MB29]|nr:pyridoxamine 5'-phosphate oxidase family protein [Saccharothrix sp. MB29]
MGMLTTRDADGRLVAGRWRSRVEFDGDLWFFAERDCKVATCGPTRRWASR